MRTNLPWANGSCNWMEPVALPNIGKTYKKEKKLCQGLYKNTVNSYTLKNTFYNYSISLWLITNFFTVELLTCPTAPLVREKRGMPDNC